MQVKKQQLELDTEQQTGSKSGMEYVKGSILSPCLFNLCAEYIMQNAGLDEAEAGVKMPANLENSAVAPGLEKVKFSFQSLRKAMPNNVQTTAQLHSSHMLVK